MHTVCWYLLAPPNQTLDLTDQNLAEPLPRHASELTLATPVAAAADGSCSAATLNCTNTNIASAAPTPPTLPVLPPVIVVPAGQPLPSPPAVAATNVNPCFNT